MPTVSLPQKPKYSELDNNSGKFEILGCYPGHGTTLGNALRRVLLSSLEGAAITSVKIKGVAHEFSTLKGVMEDVVQIILNLKKVRFRMHGEDPIRASLKFKGEGEVTAKEIKVPSTAEVINADQLIAIVTDKKTDLEMDLEIGKGLGYVPVEQREKGGKEIGTIAIDAVYTPIRRVNYEVENMRVGKKTDYEKITLEIVTDGSITPQEAFKKAVEILVNQFSTLLEFSTAKEAAAGEELEAKEEKIIKKETGKEVEKEPGEIGIEALKSLSTRTVNVLTANKINKVKDIVKLSEEEIKQLEGMGEKGIKEIKKAIGEFGITLKSHE